MFKRCSPSNRKPLQMVRHLPGNLPGRGHCGQASVNPPNSFPHARRAFYIGVSVRLEHVYCGVEEVCVCLEQQCGEVWGINAHGHACQRDQFLGIQEEEKPLLRYSQ
ncbi:hypothetical protein QQF64_016010 [Cirrhinus molitorella]|uniref:Uncharacterized protein n=1 Tax=Cirrhinus molitorella TaxID=172907 RepID=A0ABR3LP56_9TELE